MTVQSMVLQSIRSAEAQWLKPEKILMSRNAEIKFIHEQGGSLVKMLE